MTETPWWLESGSESCHFCLRTFHYEAACHCIDCDMPICPVCVETRFERRATLCPECHAQDSQGSDGVGERGRH